MLQTFDKVVRGNQAEIANWLKFAKVGETKDFVLKAADQAGNLGSVFFRTASGGAERISGQLKGASLVLEKTGAYEVTPITIFPE